MNEDNSIFLFKINDHRDGEQNESPIIQVETLSDLLHSLDTQNFMGLDCFHPRVLIELLGELTKPLSFIY